MHIRRSLKIYFFFVITSVGVITVLGLSTLSASYFSEGADMAMKYSMVEIGKEIKLVDDRPRYILGFSIVRHWDEVPALVRTYIPELKTHLAYGKYFEKKGFFYVPTLAVFALRYDRGPHDVVYISRLATDIVPLEHSSRLHIPVQYIKLLLYAVIAIVAFIVMTLLLIRRIAIPVEQLIIWAKGLSPDKLNQPIPDFHYNELNKLSEILRSSFQSVQTSLEREKQFLSHASHELRTPISVVRSNSELMKKLIERGENTQEKQQEVLCRVLRASHTMTELCNTLLWLDRGEFGNLVKENIELGALLRQLVLELNDLIRDKNIEVSIETEAGEFMLPITLVRIVLGNLVRNAFQHTYHGKIEIIQSGCSVKITNFNYVDSVASNLGFGLGLKLTKKIIAYYRWPYHTNRFETGRDVYIEFNTQLEKSPR